LINTQLLITEGLLGADNLDCDKCPASVEVHCTCLLAKAFDKFQKIAAPNDLAEFSEFCKANATWLDDFALFTVLRNKFNNQSWNTWPQEYKNRHLAVLNDTRYALKLAIETVKFEQYIFFKQWTALKKYANERGILLFGDIPIFVSYDSADVWANRDVFKLTPAGEMSVVAGVPPDYFSETGQRWGNPHYDWAYLKSSQFDWWLSRMRTQAKLFDIVRIDHFRGLEAAWEIPASEQTAVNGEWIPASGDGLLCEIVKEFHHVSLVAEDLGIITSEVNALRTKFQLPGMKILQFAFSGNSDNPYLPQFHEPNCVVYTGTHDNDTTVGWAQSLTEEEIAFISETLHLDEAANIPQALMQCALNSTANLAILPMQDILELDSKHRMNTPGTTQNNWQWYFDWQQLNDGIISRLTEQIKQADRMPDTLN
jgi:4-alpha-glucanotransferase